MFINDSHVGSMHLALFATICVPSDVCVPARPIFPPASLTPFVPSYHKVSYVGLRAQIRRADQHRTVLHKYVGPFRTCSPLTQNVI